MSNAAQWGAGDPSGLPPPDGFYSWGGGSPTPLTIPPEAPGIGGGDPSLPDPIIVQDGGKEHGDEGGDVLVLQADWSTMGGAGPYRVQLKDPFTDVIFPQDYFGCLSPIAGDGTTFGFGVLFTDPAIQQLLVALPPAPPGVYDVVVSYGPGYGTSVTLFSAVRVINRRRTLQQWTIRSWLPPLWRGAGPRMPETQPKWPN